MKILVTGVGGQLGYDVIKELEKRNIEYVGADKAEFNITDLVATHKFITNYMPDAVIHCGAYTAVDKAEENLELCEQINRDAVANLARAAQKCQAKVIHVSTDYVFDGTSCIPYRETDTTNPQSVYGSTKRAGEEVLQEICPDAVIVRTAWLYSEYGNNFVKTM
ncbi:MAG: sugar nucleotide-binding protein, partial [Lachnospiraceae bacterium]|nr:sugar nucleotide-binding protein [Lachnospiraceae bacterium]